MRIDQHAIQQNRHFPTLIIIRIGRHPQNGHSPGSKHAVPERKGIIRTVGRIERHLLHLQTDQPLQIRNKIAIGILPQQVVGQQERFEITVRRLLFFSRTGRHFHSFQLIMPLPALALGKSYRARFACRTRRCGPVFPFPESPRQVHHRRKSRLVGNNPEMIRFTLLIISLDKKGVSLGKIVYSHHKPAVGGDLARIRQSVTIIQGHHRTAFEAVAQFAFHSPAKGQNGFGQIRIGRRSLQQTAQAIAFPPAPYQQAVDGAQIETSVGRPTFGVASQRHFQLGREP